MKLALEQASNLVKGEICTLTTNSGDVYRIHIKEVFCGDKATEVVGELVRIPKNSGPKIYRLFGKNVAAIINHERTKCRLDLESVIYRFS